MKPRLFVAGDIDGFFGLFVDNLLQLMLVAVLCQTVCGLPAELITHRILPGAALSILAGNLFYSWQAWEAPGFAMAYLASAALMVLFFAWSRRRA